MEDLVPWLTPALIVGLFGWLRADFRNLRQDINQRFDDFKQDVNQRFDGFKQDVNQRVDGLRQDVDGLKTEVVKSVENTDRRFDGLTRDMNQRFDEVNRELADQRERMAKLEGSLEGFLAGRRDRDAA